MGCLPIWGTMRMLDHSNNPSYWVKFFENLHEKGVRHLHSSTEYKTFPLLIESLRRLKEKKNITFNHIVKLGEPSFNEEQFSKERFESKLDFYKLMLPGKIEIIQWMWRSEEKDLKRIRKFVSQKKEINKVFKKYKVCCFPYTKQFGDLVIELSNLSGLIIYWNYMETDFLKIATKVSKKNKANIVLRPFINSKKNSLISNNALKFCEKIPNLKGIIFTATKKKHLNEALDFFFNKI